MKCFACVRVLAFVVGLLCVLTSVAGIIFLIWFWTTHGCLRDPEGICYFDKLRAVSVALGISLFAEVIAAVLLLAGIIKKRQSWIQIWIWYHAGNTVCIAVAIASLDRTNSVILYSILGAVVSFIIWCPVYLHWKHLANHGREQNEYQLGCDFIEGADSKRSNV